MAQNDKYLNVKKREARPPAASLVESLRDLGYTPETAVADIIDNAIFAEAKNIWIEFKWAGVESRIMFKDDGKGMNEEELAIAMRPGSQNPTDYRDPKDLGRFGLGLKTASFSQSRMFTVISKSKIAPVAIWCWDLEYVVSANGGWDILQTVSDEKDIRTVEEMDRGTLVIWENLDRIVGTEKKIISEDDFYKVAEKVKRHLEMVFHRYLENGRLNITFNGRKVKPWDPFLRGEQATQPFPEEKLGEGEILIKPYILPHRSKITENLWLEGEKRGGWNAMQGFYIYRNERLLLAADWLGFARKKSQYKLVRIMIDLPNHLDQEWQIDIKKSRARPPVSLRQDLKAVALNVMTQAEQIFRHRGKKIQRTLSDDFSFVWTEAVKHGRYFFRVNQDHPVVAAQMAKFPGKQKELMKLLRILEETVPAPAIIAKENEYPDCILRPYEKTPPKELVTLMKELLNGWKKQGVNVEEGRRKLLMIEPFSDYQEIIEAL